MKTPCRGDDNGLSAVTRLRGSGSWESGIFEIGSAVLAHVVVLLNAIRIGSSEG